MFVANLSYHFRIYIFNVISNRAFSLWLCWNSMASNIFPFVSVNCAFVGKQTITNGFHNYDFFFCPRCSTFLCFWTCLFWFFFFNIYYRNMLKNVELLLKCKNIFNIQLIQYLVSATKWKSSNAINNNNKWLNHKKWLFILSCHIEINYSFVNWIALQMKKENKKSWSW